MVATPDFRLDGRIALITGASKGIGQAIAEAMAAMGAHVIVSSRRAEAVEAVADQIRDAGGSAEAVALHVGETAQIEQVVGDIEQRHGGVDILVNNAATNPTFGPVLSTDEAVFDKIMQVNVRGPYTLSRLLQPGMARRGRGSVINISSIGGLKPEPMLGLYSVSKAALISLTRVLAREWGPAGVRVNAICPGIIRTKFSRALWENDAIRDRMLQEVPLGRIGTADEVAGLAVFLASNAASYCTGGIYTADGGHTA